MDKIQNNIDVVIPNNIYNEALNYFPKTLIDDLFSVVDRNHAGTVAVYKIDKLRRYDESARLELIEKYHKLFLPRWLIWLPIILLVVFLTIVMFMGMLTPLLVLISTVLALVSSIYITTKQLYCLEQQKYANSIMRDILAYVNLELVIRSSAYYEELSKYNTSLVDLAKIESDEFRIRYEGAINYFYSVDKNLTNEYIATMSPSSIYVIPHETMQ